MRRGVNCFLNNVQKAALMEDLGRGFPYWCTFTFCCLSSLLIAAYSDISWEQLVLSLVLIAHTFGIDPPSRAPTANIFLIIFDRDFTFLSIWDAINTLKIAELWTFTARGGETNSQIRDTLHCQTRTKLIVIKWCQNKWNGHNLVYNVQFEVLKKFTDKAQTASFRVFAMGNQLRKELFAEKMNNWRN